MSRSDRKHRLNITNNNNMAAYYAQSACKENRQRDNSFYAQKWLKGDKNKLKRSASGV